MNLLLLPAITGNQARWPTALANLIASSRVVALSFFLADRRLEDIEPTALPVERAIPHRLSPAARRVSNSISPGLSLPPRTTGGRQRPSSGATAPEIGVPIYTGNARHFKMIPDLEVLQP